jgi:hypothetical protein
MGEKISYSRIVCILNELGKGRVEVVAEYPVEPLAHVQEAILNTLKEVNSWTEFPPKACHQCQWCSVPGCPIREETRHALVASHAGVPTAAIPLELESIEQAEKAVLFLMHGEQVINHMKELLRKWVQEHGPVIAGGKIAEERPNNPWEVTDLQKLVRTMVTWGVNVEDIWKAMNLTEKAITKLTKRAGISHKLPVILSMGQRKEYKPKFGLYTDKLR